AYFVSAMAVWNFGVFMLRRTSEASTAHEWEVLIHAGIILVPAFYYHFVLIFLDRTSQNRGSLFLAYFLALVFLALNFGTSNAFITGVRHDYWGWVPATGPLYQAFFIYFNAFFIWGLVHMTRGYEGLESSFRRNRARLIQIGTVITLIGAMVAFLRFILTRFVPEAPRICAI